jgi:hypothetical protein
MRKEQRLMTLFTVLISATVVLVPLFRACAEPVEMPDEELGQIIGSLGNCHCADLFPRGGEEFCTTEFCGCPSLGTTAPPNHWPICTAGGSSCCSETYSETGCKRRYYTGLCPNHTGGCGQHELLCITQEDDQTFVPCNSCWEDGCTGKCSC